MMSTSGENKSTGVIAVLTGGIGLCCGLPLLLGAGVAIGTVGIVAGRLVLVAIGAAVALWAVRLRRRATGCDVAEHERPPRN